jgi:hypothetical protein
MWHMGRTATQLAQRQGGKSQWCEAVGQCQHYSGLLARTRQRTPEQRRNEYRVAMPRYEKLLERRGLGGQQRFTWPRVEAHGGARGQQYDVQQKQGRNLPCTVQVVGVHHAIRCRLLERMQDHCRPLRPRRRKKSYVYKCRRVRDADGRKKAPRRGAFLASMGFNSPDSCSDGTLPR